MAFLSSEQLATAFGILGNIISFLVFLAPLSTFYRIYKKKSTESFQSLPYQVALFSSMMWLYYALLKGISSAFLLVTINSFGSVLETIYIAMFIAYSPKNSRLSAIKLFLALNVGLFSLILIVTHFLVRGPDRVSVLGWICVSFAVSVFAAPLSTVVQVIRTKSVEFMPFNLSFFLTLSAIMWFAYGLFKKDMCIALPNIGGFVLGMLQMIVYAIYRNSNKVIKEKLPEQKKDIAMDSSNLAPADAYPVDVEPYVNFNVEDDAKEQLGNHEKKQSKEASGDLHPNECAAV